jgi:hypothetical protein
MTTSFPLAFELANLFKVYFFTDLSIDSLMDEGYGWCDLNKIKNKVPSERKLQTF